MNTSSSAGTTPPRATATALIDALTDTVHHLHTLSVIVEDYKPNSQPLFFDQLNSYVMSLQDLESKSTSYEAMIPKEILGYLDRDQNNNPELFTKHQLDLVGYNHTPSPVKKLMNEPLYFLV